MPHIKNNISVANKPSKLLNFILGRNHETHVRISAEGRKIIDNPKLSSEMVKTLVEQKKNFIEGKPIKVGANGSTISVTQVSDSIKIGN